MKQAHTLLIIVSVFSILALKSAYGQVNVSTPNQAKRLDKSVFGLGFAAGMLSGAGLSFRHHVPERFSYQITGGIIKVEDDLSYNIGFEPQFDLVNGQTTRFFALVGLGYYYSGKPSPNEVKGPFRLGAGIGIEWNVSGGFHITIAGAFLYSSDGNILPLPQCGAHYYFL